MIILLSICLINCTKASHPDVSSNVNTNPVVPLLCTKIVIPNKHHLHPSFPFFSLISEMIKPLLSVSKTCFALKYYKHSNIHLFGMGYIFFALMIFFFCGSNCVQFWWKNKSVWQWGLKYFLDKYDGL